MLNQYFKASQWTKRAAQLVFVSILCGLMLKNTVFDTPAVCLAYAEGSVSVLWVLLVRHRTLTRCLTNFTRRAVEVEWDYCVRATFWQHRFISIVPHRKLRHYVSVRKMLLRLQIGSFGFCWAVKSHHFGLTTSLNQIVKEAGRALCGCKSNWALKEARLNSKYILWKQSLDDSFQ